MDIYGLVGKGLSHSFSPVYFNEKFAKLGIDAEYRLFDLDDIAALPAIINATPELKGLNITIPYKRKVFEFLNCTDPVAQHTGSINTLKIERLNNVNRISGYNTDVIGFEHSIKDLLKDTQNRKALILGTGGSSKAVAYVLRKLGFFYLFASRNPQKDSQLGYAYIDRKIMENYKLIINTTPLGMFPNIDSFPPLPYHLLTSDHILFDLVYNPKETRFLAFGKEQGAKVLSGLNMLEIQAEASWKIWRK